MQLSYRGFHPIDFLPVEILESGDPDTERRQGLPVIYPQHIPVPQSMHPLKYQGASYRASVTSRAERCSSALTVSRWTVEPGSLQGQTCQVKSPGLEKTHRIHLQRRLQHRIEVAQAKGDLDLLHLLENEQQQVG